MKLSKIITACFCFTLLLINSQCDDDDVVEPPCDQNVVIDNGFYEAAQSDPFEVITSFFDGSCFTVELSSSGCDGNTWSMVLVDSGNVAESSPEQRYLKLVLTNDEDCLAVIQQTRSFDLSALEIIPNSDGTSELILNIEGFPEPVTYFY